MNQLIKVSFIVAAIAASNVALAADNYTGSYAGVTFTQWSADDSTSTIDKSGATIKVGYDFDKTWAVEGRINLAQYKDSDSTSTIKVSTPAALYGKFRYSINDSVAPYAVAGLAYNSYSYDETASSDLSSSTKSIGFSAGIGAEIAITKKIKATVEYTYLGENDFYDASAWSIGANYKF